MLVQELLEKKPAPISIHMERTIADAMRLLIDNKIGGLVIVDDEDHPIGMITERDIFKLAYRFRGDVMDMPVGDHMTRKLILSFPDDKVEHVGKTMLEKGIRHVPITDDKDRLCGILSIRDIVRVLLPQKKQV